MKLSIFNDLTLLPNISDRAKSNLKRLLSNTRIIDLLLHSPISILKRKRNTNVNTTKIGEIVTVAVQIIEHQPSQRKHSPYRVVCKTKSNTIVTLTFFHANQHYLLKILPINSYKVISGKLGKSSTIVHPDYIVNHDSDIKDIEPIYPLTRGVSNKMLLDFIRTSLTLLPSLPEWIENEVMNINHWNKWHETINYLHNPKDLDNLQISRERLAYDEFFAYQLQLHKIRHHNKKQSGQSTNGDGHLRKYALERLPFELTQGQKEVISDITKDQGKTQRMIRLLQGDVGSGKTVVALFAILNAIECKKQAAFMVPTETLAIQHTEWIQSIIGDKIQIALLTSKTKSKKTILSDLESGKIQIIIGTHSLFQDKIIFHNLALAVIDEQHRFGLKQRIKLSSKGENVDLLLMSATPIPRTLNLTLFGDIDCSILQEKPKNRLPIKTSIIQKNNIDHVITNLKTIIEEGAKIYWVCPLVKESEKVDMMAVLERFEHLSATFKNKIGLVHGQMKAQEREEAILQFKNNDINILVSTTVIEVGIDIPDANVMIIENAERFGLSQLHQLRGRVGRGNRQSYCILLYDNASKTTHARLKAVRDSNDGFYIAEQDLKIRGGGEIAGYKQSGLPDFKFANLQEENFPFTTIHNQAKDIIQTDPTLENSPQLKILLKIFNHTTFIE